MIRWAMALGELLHVVLALVVLLVVLPAWALRRLPTSGWPVAYWIPAGLSFFLVSGIGLAALGVTHFAVLAMMIILGLFISGRIHQQASTEDNERSLSRRFMDVLDDPTQSFRQFLTLLIIEIRRQWANLLTQYQWPGFLLASSGLVIAFIRNTIPVWSQASPGTPLGYFDVLGIATLANNLGLYHNGVGPFGLFGFGSSVATLFLMAPLELLRFLYPATACLTLLAVGAMAFELTGSGLWMGLAMFLSAISRFAELGLSTNLASPLSIHLAVMSLIFGLGHLIAYQQNPTAPASRGRARIFGLTLATTVCFSLELGLIEAGLGLLVAVWMILSRANRPALWDTVWWAICLGLGLAPLFIGRLLGKPWGLAGWQMPTLPVNVPLWMISSTSFHGGLIVALLLSGYVLVFPPKPSLRVLGALLALIAIPAMDPMAYDAVGNLVLGSGLLGLVTLLVSLTAGQAVLESIRTTGAGRVLPNTGWGLVAVGVLSLFWPSSVYSLTRFEPPGTGSATLSIIVHYPPYRWTIVSPVDQYSEVLGKGWQEELSLFVQRYTLAQAQDPHFRLAQDRRYPLLSPYVFLYSEPALFPHGPHVTTSDENLPILPGDAAYHGRSLMAVESRAYYWTVAYHRSHPHTSQFVVRTRYLWVLLIRQ